MTLRDVFWSWKHSELPKSVRAASDTWMRYIQDEVRTTCRAASMKYQIRRKWSVRDTPVSESLVDDYEWKLIPGTYAELPEHHPDAFDEGVYYVLSFQPQGAKFVLLHDTHREGSLDIHWQWVTSTEIQFAEADTSDRRSPSEPAYDARLHSPPTAGWLARHLAALTSRFGPNHFSLT